MIGHPIRTMVLVGVAVLAASPVTCFAQDVRFSPIPTVPTWEMCQDIWERDTQAGRDARDNAPGSRCVYGSYDTDCEIAWQGVQRWHEAFQAQVDHRAEECRNRVRSAEAARAAHEAAAGMRQQVAVSTSEYIARGIRTYAAAQVDGLAAKMQEQIAADIRRSFSPAAGSALLGYQWAVTNGPEAYERLRSYWGNAQYAYGLLAGLSNGSSDPQKAQEIAGVAESRLIVTLPQPSRFLSELGVDILRGINQQSFADLEAALNSFDSSVTASAMTQQIGLRTASVSGDYLAQLAAPAPVATDALGVPLPEFDDTVQQMAAISDAVAAQLAAQQRAEKARIAAAQAAQERAQAEEQARLDEQARAEQQAEAERAQQAEQARLQQARQNYADEEARRAAEAEQDAADQDDDDEQQARFNRQILRQLARPPAGFVPRAPSYSAPGYDCGNVNRAC